MSVSFYPYVYVSDGYTMPEGVSQRMHACVDTDDLGADWEENPLYDSRLDVNLCNRNASEVLNEIGVVNMCESDPMPIDAFALAVQEARRRITADLDPAIEERTETSRSGPTIIFGGRRAGYLAAVFERLASLVEAAREHGATHIGWG